jgi:hypothetical protein
LTFGRLANYGQTELTEQNLLQLFRRAEIKGSAGKLMRLGFKSGHFRRQFAALFPEHVAIDEYAGFLHREQNRHQRLLDVLINLLAPGGFLQLTPEVLM